MSSDELRPPLQPGESAPHFRLPEADREGMVSLAGYHGRPLLLTLMRGLHCPFCRRNIVRLGGMAPMLRQLGVETLAIIGTTADRARRPRSGDAPAVRHPLLPDVPGAARPIQDDSRRPLPGAAGAGAVSGDQWRGDPPSSNCAPPLRKRAADCKHGFESRWGHHHPRLYRHEDQRPRCEGRAASLLPASTVRMRGVVCADRESGKVGMSR